MWGKCPGAAHQNRAGASQGAVTPPWPEGQRTGLGPDPFHHLSSWGTRGGGQPAMAAPSGEAGYPCLTLFSCPLPAWGPMAKPPERRVNDALRCRAGQPPGSERWAREGGEWAWRAKWGPGGGVPWAVWGWPSPTVLGHLLGYLAQGWLYFCSLEVPRGTG